MDKSGRDEYPAIITSFKNGNVTYVSASKGLDHKYTLNDIKTEIVDIPSNLKILKNGDGTVSVDDGINKFTLKDTSISSRDFSDMADYTSKNLTSNLKEFNDNILKLQNKCKDILDKMSGSNVDEVVKNNLKTIQYLGGRVSVDMCLSIMDSIKNYVKALVIIHNESTHNLPNFRLLTKCYSYYGIYSEMKFLNPSKTHGRYPYMEATGVFDEIGGGRGSSKTIPIAGFCPIISAIKASAGMNLNYVKGLTEYLDKCKELGVDENTVSSIIHLNTATDSFDLNFVYFHEMGHAVLDQEQNIDAKYYEAYMDAKAAGVTNNRVGIAGISEHNAVNYTENPIEVQADAFACLMTGGTWKTMWEKRFFLKGWSVVNIYGYRDWWASLGLNDEELKVKEENYKKLFEKETTKVKQWANAGCMARLKTWVKSL